MSGIRILWKGVMAAFLVVSLFFSSGCALLLVGAGGAGGYMIRKGEEGDSSKKKESSRLKERSPLTGRVESVVAYAPDERASQESALWRGDTP